MDNCSTSGYERKVIFFFALFFIAILIGYFIINFLFLGNKTGTMVLNEKDIELVKIAESKEARLDGLSSVEKIQPNQGLLMKFSKDDRWSIWMRGVDYPIDVLWLYKDMKIVYIVESMSPDSYPKSFKPTKASRYVLELHNGYVKKNSIRRGMVAKMKEES